MLTRKDGIIQANTVKASSTVAVESVVAYDTSGVKTHTNAGKFAGIAIEAGAAGDVVRMYQTGSFKMTFSSISAADLYKPVYSLNGTLSFTSTTGALLIGVLVEVINSTTGFVLIDGQIGNTAAA